jgi:leucine dehydrogenase
MNENDVHSFFDRIAEYQHEQLSAWYDPESGYRGLIAIHSTRLGPALGGTRFWNYRTDTAAMTDVLRLSRGMTYKAAIAGLALGGGKGVIIGNNKTPDRYGVFRAHGRHVESLGGRYITAEDVGTNPRDMAIVKQETDHVVGLTEKSGDPSPVTAFGVFRGILACLDFRYGSDSPEGRTVAVQGIGNVGYHLCKLLHDHGARLLVTDIDAEKVERAVQEFGATPMDADELIRAEANVFAPCALGAVINDESLRFLKVDIIAGAANNQLAEDRHGDILHERGIVYAPDYVINAGGLINVGAEVYGYTLEWAREKASQIYDTITGILEIARDEMMPSYRASRLLARRKLEEAKPENVKA